MAGERVSSSLWCLLTILASSCGGTVTVEKRCNEPLGRVLLQIDGTSWQQHDGIAVGDINGDRYPDLVTGDEPNAKLRCFLGTASGISISASWTVDYPYHSDSPMISLGDVDGDGVDDLMMGGRRIRLPSGTYQTLVEPELFLGSRAGLPNTATFKLSGHREAYSIHAQDVDCSPGRELVLGEGWDESIDFSDTVSAEVHRWNPTSKVLLQEGTVGIDGYAARATKPANNAGDINGDGCDDLMLISGHEFPNSNHRDGLAVYLASAGGPSKKAWEGNDQEIGYPAAAVSVGDFNRDGYGDVVLRAQEPKGLVFKLLLGSSTGAMIMGQKVLVPDEAWYGALAAADVNGDGVIDLIAPSGVFLGVDGGFLETTAVFHFAHTALAKDSLSVADVNGDGCQDMFVASRRDTIEGRGFGSVTVYAGGNVEEP